nr:glutathione S-transferase family protein [Deltaproteobacteria bacterium]
DGHLPLFHYVPARRVGGGRTVPILVDGKTVLADSTGIVEWADARKEGALYPENAADKVDALALEDDFDTHLGPATRRWAYFQMLPHVAQLAFLMKGVPRYEQLAFKATRPLAIAFLKRSLKVDDEGAERSRMKIEDTFGRLSQHLADGRRFLIGDRFSVADLTFAALAAPVLLPEGHPIAFPPLSEYSEAARTQMTAWRESPAGQFGLRMYRDHRDERMTVVMTRGATG